MRPRLRAERCILTPAGRAALDEWAAFCDRLDDPVLQDELVAVTARVINAVHPHIDGEPVAEIVRY